MAYFGPLSQEIYARHWEETAHSVFFRSSKVGRHPSSDPRRIRTDGMCHPPITEEIQDCISRELEASRKREEDGIVVIPDQPSRAHRNRKDRKYFPDPTLLRKSINFEKIPSLESILRRNRECGLEMFSEGAEERIIAELGKSEPSNITLAMQKMEEPEVEPTPLSTHDTILTISIYHSERHTKTEEFLCLGSQPLSMLRDKIYCLSDGLEQQVGTDSGFFFIEGVFYNDMRGETSRDYSRQLIKWAHENGNWALGGFPEMRSELMETSKWDSIPVRVGAQYCYCHCGDCEHIVVIDSIRLVQEDDYPNANAYPLRTFRSKARRRKCQICNVYPSKHVCHDDIFMDATPFLCCTRCFTAMHYRSDESLKYEVESYKYEHE